MTPPRVNRVPFLGELAYEGQIVDEGRGWTRQELIDHFGDDTDSVRLSFGYARESVAGHPTSWISSSAMWREIWALV